MACVIIMSHRNVRNARQHKLHSVECNLEMTVVGYSIPPSLNSKLINSTPSHRHGGRCTPSVCPLGLTNKKKTMRVREELSLARACSNACLATPCSPSCASAKAALSRAQASPILFPPSRYLCEECEECDDVINVPHSVSIHRVVAVRPTPPSTGGRGGQRGGHRWGCFVHPVLVRTAEHHTISAHLQASEPTPKRSG